MADLDVGVEREAVLVDREGRELGAQDAQELDVDDELLEARDEAALEPAGRVQHQVGAREERRLVRDSAS